ncbi:MAG: type VI secretion system protein TssA [Burkholderiales bacterium]|nr:type VI secretion system protein TssA [Burkholderiales bacterium]
MSAVSSLLQPISDAHPCGEDLSFSPELDAIAQARRFDDPTLDQGEWVTTLKEADWGAVVQLCTSLLSTRSKDLRLAVWFTEASAKTRHFRGLGDGFSLIGGLCDGYWDGVHPLAEDDDQDIRVGNLSWILARTVQMFREIPLTEGKDSAFSLADFESARTRAMQSEKNVASGGRPEEGVKLATLEAARHKSSRKFYEGLLADSQYCLDALQQMEKSVDARLGMDGPTFSAAKNSLDQVMRTVARFAADIGIKSTLKEEAETTETESLPSTTTVATMRNGPIQNRTQALAQLRAVAEFFRQTEPHSPVAYLAEKAAHWGDLPLHEWLKTVIKDSASMAHIEELLGLQMPPADGH